VAMSLGRVALVCAARDKGSFEASLPTRTNHGRRRSGAFHELPATDDFIYVAGPELKVPNFRHALRVTSCRRGSNWIPSSVAGWTDSGQLRQCSNSPQAGRRFRSRLSLRGVGGVSPTTACVRTGCRNVLNSIHPEQWKTVQIGRTAQPRRIAPSRFQDLSLRS
jgi:hypothetical protein